MDIIGKISCKSLLGVRGFKSVQNLMPNFPNNENFNTENQNCRATKHLTPRCQNILNAFIMLSL